MMLFLGWKVKVKDGNLQRNRVSHKELVFVGIFQEDFMALDLIPYLKSMIMIRFLAFSMFRVL